MNVNSINSTDISYVAVIKSKPVVVEIKPNEDLVSIGLPMWIPEEYKFPIHRKKTLIKPTARIDSRKDR